MRALDAKYFGIKLSSNRIKNNKGQLIVTGCTFARTGKQKYHNSELGLEGDGFKYLDRPVEEVSSPATVASFEGAPLTLDHPEEDVKVGVNWDTLAKGLATNVKYVADSDKSGHLEADLIFTDPEIIDEVVNHRINELSAGYNCEVDENTWTQRKIRGNHIAIVESARAGHQAVIRDKAYKSKDVSKTIRVGDKEYTIVDSYTYDIVNTQGKTERFKDYLAYNEDEVKETVKTVKIKVRDISHKYLSKEEKELKNKWFNSSKTNTEKDNTDKDTKNNKGPRVKGLPDEETKEAVNQAIRYLLQGNKLSSSLDRLEKRIGALKEGNTSLQGEEKSNNKILLERAEKYRNVIINGCKKDFPDLVDSYKQVKDSDIDEKEQEIFNSRREIDTYLRKVFADNCFDITGFLNGVESTEGDIFVIDYNPFKDKKYLDLYKKRINRRSAIIDKEDYVTLAVNYIKDIYSNIFAKDIHTHNHKYNIDAFVSDWDYEEEYPITLHIYCDSLK